MFADCFYAHYGDVRECVVVSIKVVNNRKTFLVETNVRSCVDESCVELGGSFADILKFASGASY